MGFFPKCNIIIGGPPCQSFSNARTGGYVGGYRSRAGLSNVKVMQDVVNHVLPEMFICENATTLLQQSMQDAYEFFMEGFGKHYRLKVMTLNSEDYGLPQMRKRCFIVGVLKEYDVYVPIPTGCHWSMHYSGWADYLNLPSVGWMSARGSNIKAKTPFEAAYTVTCAELPVIRFEQPKRTGTLFANERALLDQRYLSLGELAALQGFPSDWQWVGNAGEIREQIGNAWSVNVARALAVMCKEVLNGIKRIR